VVVSTAADPAAAGSSLTFTATLQPAPSCGSVSWLIDNGPPPAGTTTSGSGASFTLGPVTGLSVGVHPVTAVFSGCASASEASGTILEQITAPTGTGTGTPPPVTNVVAPTIAARITGGGPKHHGWYRAPVTVVFSCTAGSSALAAPCPTPVTLRRSGGAQDVTKTITGADGGASSITVAGINIDLTPPKLHVTGAVNGDTYRHGRVLHCDASDSLSGVASCVIHQHRKTRHRVTVVRWTAVATDEAGNRTTKSGHYFI
jgi:hypothetical protein